MDYLDEGMKRRIKDGLAGMKTVIPGFCPRRQQLQMIAEVSRVLAGDTDERVGVVEAGTGSGKSFGYGLPAVAVATARQQRLVISVSTISLQEQLLQRDLPMLAQGTGWSFTTAIAKGRSRYGCPLKMSKASAPAVRALLAAFRERTWAGDKESVPGHLSVDWAGIAASSQDCIGRACPWYAECPAEQARAAVRQADIVVTNHDLLVADLRAGPGVLLPEPEKCLLVVDEAHGLPEKARNTREGFGVEYAQGALRRSAKRLSTALRRWRFLLGFAEWWRLGQTARALGALSRCLVRLPWPDPTASRWLFDAGVVPRELLATARTLVTASGRLAEHLQERRLALLQDARDGRLDPLVAQEVNAVIGEIGGIATQIGNALALFCARNPGTGPPPARWIDRREEHGQWRHRLRAAEVSAAAFLEEMLWRRTAGAALASATITSMGTFDRFVETCGLRGHVRTLRLPPVFDYQRQGVLCVPSMAHAPDAPGHTAEVCALIRARLRPGEGLLTLFTSRQAMNQAEDLLRDLGPALLVQDRLPKSELLRRHAENIQDGRLSVILGMQSMSEGVDLPGKLCATVVIAKLPFSVPTHPVEITEATWLRQQGRDPFREMTLPATSVKLMQAVGRLIRKETDTGMVIIADNRMTTRRYGQSLLQGLPPFRLDLGRPLAQIQTPGNPP